MSDAPPDPPVHILLVEDEPAIRDALVLVLELEGYHVTPAVDGLDAWDKLPEARPDVIVTDYMMPGITGDELVRRIRADAAYDDLPILLISAGISESLERLADAYLQKPVKLDRLLDTLQQLLTPS